MSGAQLLEPLYIYSVGNVGCCKSFLMKVLYQSLTKILSYGNVSLGLMDLTVVAAINNDRTTVYTVINIPINQFGKKLTTLSNR